MCNGTETWPRRLVPATTRRKSFAETKTVEPPTRMNLACRKRASVTHGSKIDALQTPDLGLNALSVHVPFCISTSFMMRSGLTDNRQRGLQPIFCPLRSVLCHGGGVLRAEWVV